MSLPTLFQGRRGTWIYQSPRILFILSYAEAKKLDKAVIYTRHIDRIKRLGPHQSWILQRLGYLGYATKKGGEPDLSAVEGLASRLSLDFHKLVTAVEAALKAANAKRPEDVALLPPVLTLPEKVVLLEALAKSDRFHLKKSISIFDSDKIPHNVDPDAYRRERRFRKAYLYSLHLLSPEGRPTLLGYALAYRMAKGADAVSSYLRLLEASGRLKYVVALEALALDVGTMRELKNLVETYQEALSALGHRLDLSATYYVFSGMKSDVEDFMIGLAKPLEWLLEILET